MAPALPSAKRRFVLPVLSAMLLALLALWLRWPTFDFSLWNVDEAIHAAAARSILEGGVLYRDAIDQRTPLSYYAVAGVFALCGENNLWAVRCGIALLIAGTAWLLFLAGRALHQAVSGGAAAVLYVLLATGVLYQGDANALNTEWFVAFFSSAAAAFLAGRPSPGPGRLLVTGLLYGCAFLSKQPALLEVAAPLAALLYVGWHQSLPGLTTLRRMTLLIAGGLAPVLLTAIYLAVNGALRDAVFYTWTYNLGYYGPEISLADRLISLLMPFRIIGGTQPWLLGLWITGAFVTLHRLLQRVPTPVESATNPGLVFLAVWSLAGLAGAGSGGRGFDHYTIQFLAPFCLGGGLVLARLGGWLRCRAKRRPGRILAALLLAIVAWQAVSAAIAARDRTLPEDPSRRVAAYIHGHSSSADRIFVWGYHPDIYLYADRKPASRFIYASFLTGLIPWTNTAPTRDTRYAIVPGAMDTLLLDLTTRPPLFIVDCSAGPNRFWQKYPPENFPALQTFIRRRYRPVEAQQFAPQGFRLYQLRPAGETITEDQTAPPLPDSVLATLRIGTLGSPLAPTRASAPHGASLIMAEGRSQLFAHAPSSIIYRLPAEAAVLRGGFGLMPGAYVADNAGPTDGAEFIIRWRPAGGSEQVLLRRLLRPREEPADRGILSFRISLPPHHGGELELVTGPGPSENPASDWTYWSDLVLENSH